MPRDLGLEKPSSPAAVTLTESPNSVGTERSDLEGSPDQQQPQQHQSQQQREDGVEAGEEEDEDDDDDDDSPISSRTQFIVIPQDQQSQYKQQLLQRQQSTSFHPYTRPLTISDLEAVVALENAAFDNPAERASREKLRYRLSKCGELCYGLFCTVVPNSGVKAATLAAGRPVETSRRDGAVSVLIGHIISAKTTAATVTDEAMDFPKDWESPTSSSSTSTSTAIGHQDRGRTIALHSVGILPEFQSRGLGRVLMMSYMQNMNGAGIADRLALIAHDHKVEWYEKLGFINRGKSAAQFGGGGWFDMIYELKAIEAQTTYG